MKCINKKIFMDKNDEYIFNSEIKEVKFVDRILSINTFNIMIMIFAQNQSQKILYIII